MIAPTPSATSTPRKRGFTLIELMVSMALTLLLLAGVWTMFDIFSSLQKRGERQTARARLTRGLYRQMQDDISQATFGNPPGDSNRLLIGALAPPPKPPEPPADEEPEEEPNGSKGSKDKGDEEEADEDNSRRNSLGGIFDEEEEEDPNITADAGSLGKKEEKRDTPFSFNDRSDKDSEETDSRNPNAPPSPFARTNATQAQPPEYALVVGGPTWMILDLPIPKGEETAADSLLNSGGGSRGKWTAARTHQRIIYHYVAPEDLLGNDKLTLGLTRWKIDWQAAPIATLIEELRKDEFSAPNSIIWQKPKNSGAGSSLSFVAADGPPVDREEIPELRRVLFRYYSKKAGWSSQWNSVARRELPSAIQMRVLWNDPRTPAVDNSDMNARDRAIQANTRGSKESRFSADDGRDEAELLAEWDEDLDRGYSTNSFATTSSRSSEPPEGYAEYMFTIPATNPPIRPERLR